VKTSDRHVALRDMAGVWWLVNADGERFFSLGVNHVSPALWLRGYNRGSTLARYGQDLVGPDGRFDPHGQAAAEWAEAVVGYMRDWGFNTLGTHTYGAELELLREHFYYVKEWSPFGHQRHMRAGARFPDVFSPSFEEDLQRSAAREVRPHRNSPNLIGYSYTDGPLWVVSEWQRRRAGYRADGIHPWVEDLLELPAGAPGKQAILEVLQSHYTDPHDCARAYGVEAGTWEQLAEVRTWPEGAHRASAERDSGALLPAIARRWYAGHRKAVKEVDPTHLILGDKLWSYGQDAPPDWLFPILREHIDVLFTQTSMREEEWPVLAAYREKTGLPVIQGDTGFAFLRQRQSDVKGERVADAEEMGQSYYRYLRAMAAETWFLGWHFCGFLEEWDDPNVTTPWPCENGFLDPYETPHEAALVHVRMANARARAWHEGADVKPPSESHQDTG